MIGGGILPPPYPSLIAPLVSLLIHLTDRAQNIIGHNGVIVVISIHVPMKMSSIFWEIKDAGLKYAGLSCAHSI